MHSELENLIGLSAKNKGAVAKQFLLFYKS
jgi:hypothetical protein